MRVGMIAFAIFGLTAMACAGPIVEKVFTSTKAYADPFNEVELDVIFISPSGTELRVPAFWAGGGEWRVRYSSMDPGKHQFRTVCSDPRDAGLHGVTGEVEIAKYDGTNPLYRHGPIRVAGDKRHFEHADGTPFFWLGDTWWMGLCHRLQWPAEFQRLAQDRKQKGFSVIQIVAGLYPDMHPFDPRGANEAGFPWEADYARIRPEYFDAADRRLQYLVEQGLAPCIVGAWGYYIEWMGVEKAKKHWRYLIARYGAMPVIWCAAGEANLPWYLAKGFPYDDRKQVTQWTQVMRYIRDTDPFRRPLTIHPTGIGRLSARHATDDASLLDFDMLQTPHGQREAIEPTVRTVRESYADKPIMPVINGEAAYEMLFDSLPTEWTRRMFWLCMTSGAAGHTYGANGIWQCNRHGEPHGPSPHHAPGNGYGALPWDAAMNLPGSAQVALGRKLLERFEWWKFEPNGDWAEYHAGDDGKIAWGEWIWHAADGDAAKDAPVAKRSFMYHFKIPAGVDVERAVIHVTADDRFVLKVNDARIGASDNGDASWRRPATFDIAAHLGQGGNTLIVEAENVKSDVASNPAGLLCGGEATLADGTKISLASSSKWVSRDADAKRQGTDEFWPGVKVLARYGEGPWGGFLSADKPPIAAAGVADSVRVVYVPSPAAVRLMNLTADWRCVHFNPASGDEKPIELKVGSDGSCIIPPPAGANDWVMVLTRK